MDISAVRQRVLQTIERTKQQAAARRARNDEAARAFDPFLETTAVPLVRQLAQVLRAEGHSFTVFTPSGSVRLMSDRSAEDFVELSLDTSGDSPNVVGRMSRRRGSRVHDAEDALGPPDRLSEEDVLTFLLKAIEPFVER